MYIETNLNELEKLEDKDIEIKKKVKKDHKINLDDFFYRIKLTYNNYSKICRTKQKDLNRGSYLIVPTPYGQEIGIVLGKVICMDQVLSEDEILEVIRIASKSDVDKYKNNQKKAPKHMKLH